jgi:hypothetical protein
MMGWLIFAVVCAVFALVLLAVCSVLATMFGE